MNSIKAGTALGEALGSLPCSFCIFTLHSCWIKCIRHSPDFPPSQGEYLPHAAAASCFHVFPIIESFSSLLECWGSTGWMAPLRPCPYPLLAPPTQDHIRAGELEARHSHCLVSEEILARKCCGHLPGEGWAVLEKGAEQLEQSMVLWGCRRPRVRQECRREG